MPELKKLPDDAASAVEELDSIRIARPAGSRSIRTAALTGAFATACTATGLVFAPALVRLANGSRPITLDQFDHRLFDTRMRILLVGLLLSAWLLVPFFTSVVESLRARWRTAYTVAGLSTVSAFLSAFIIHFGNRQFGSWDFSILIDTGWRQILGQIPYTDFITPNPPGFNLGIKYAFELFGVNWDAEVYFTAIFATLTFLWAYWLLTRVLNSRLAAFLIAFAIQGAVILPLCFWWYNDSASMLATLFFLSCLFYARQPDSPAAQVSYFLSLTGLVLMKPNTAGLAGICGILFLIVSLSNRRRLAILTLGAAVLTFLILFLNRLSIPAMLASYRAAAIERGGFSTFGLTGMTRLDELELLVWTIALSAPLFSLITPFRKRLESRDWRTVSLYLFLAATLPIAAYGMATDGEIKEVECGMLLAAGAVVAFGLRLSRPRLRRFYVAVVFAMTVTAGYTGAVRFRVFTISPHHFFEWRKGNIPVGNKFFRDTHASPLMRDTIREVNAAESQNPGPYFLGPGLEFTYAVLGVPSPTHLPVYWQPGTSFARKEEPSLRHVWNQHQFNTLIFLNGDYAFYSPAMMSLIRGEYREDHRYPDITLYHRR